MYFSQNHSNFTLLTNNLTPIRNSGSVVPVPYLPGHDYALLPGTDNGLLDIKYSATLPDCIQNYRYSFHFGHPEVPYLQENSLNHICSFLGFNKP